MTWSSVFVSPLSLMRIRWKLCPPFGSASAFDVEDLAARVVAEDQLVRQLRHRLVAIGIDAGGGGEPLEDRVGVVELGDGVHHLRVAALILGAHFAVEVLEAAFPHVPAVVAAGDDLVDLLVDVLADLRLEHVAVLRIPREPLRVAVAVGVDLAERVGVLDERVRRGNAVLAVRAVLAQRIDAQDLAEDRLEVLRRGCRDRRRLPPSAEPM